MTTPKSSDPRAFRAFEHDGWESVASEYHNAFGRLTAQAIGPLLDAVGVGKGVRLLDVATGPGYVAAAAAEQGASAVGVDFSAVMVAHARRYYKGAEFREGDAEELPFPEGSFDAVVMNFGLLHLGRPDQAIAEAYRVLRPEGRAGFTVWTKPEEAVGFGIVLSAVKTHGNLDVPLPQGPPFFRFSDPAEFSRALLEVGFTSPRIVKVHQAWRFGSADGLFEAMKEGTVRTAGLLRAQTAEALDAIRRATRDAVRAYEKDGVVELPMPAVLASALKP